MTNTIQSVFLSVTHVFVSIIKLFFKIWLSKMYPYFKLLIFGYISRFLTKFSTLLGFFQALNTNPPLFFVLDLENVAKKKVKKRYPIRGKNPLYGVLTSYGVPSRGQNQKIPSDSSSPCRKTPQCKKSAKFENFLKIRFFYSLVPSWGKNFDFEDTSLRAQFLKWAL